MVLRIYERFHDNLTLLDCHKIVYSRNRMSFLLFKRKVNSLQLHFNFISSLLLHSKWNLFKFALCQGTYAQNPPIPPPPPPHSTPCNANAIGWTRW